MSRSYIHQVRGVAETAAWIGYSFLDRMKAVSGNFAWGCVVEMAAPWAQEAEREWKKFERSSRNSIADVPPYVDWLNGFYEKKLEELKERLAREAEERKAKAKARMNAENAENAESAERRQDGQEGGF